MPINTDLNVSPYFDDFNEENNFHRVIFKPSVAVQARELTQLQTILQNQIERFGENILHEGSIVKGGNFTDLSRLPYVKIRDNNINNQPIAISNYEGAHVTGQYAGVTATVLTALPGLESQTPDLNTLYVKYTRTGIDPITGNDIKTFLPGETLFFSVGGNPQDELNVSIVPTFVDPEPIGTGYGVRCGDGVIFQKGHFIRFENQLTIVSKYNPSPSGVVVGFQTDEFIINSNNDTSLLDNAAGFNNEAAPGADRLMLIPRLVTLDNVQAEADETFFAIQEYENGRLVRRNTTTQFNSINKLLQQRTSEESGNYSIGNFNIRVDDKRDSSGVLDTDNLSAIVDPGVAYVEGQRVELVGALSVDVPKATDFNTVQQQDIIANYGNYIIVDGFYGAIDINANPKIEFRSAAQSATSTIGFNAAGTKIGESHVRSITRHDATSYRIYLFNTVMNSGQSFSNVRSIVYNTNKAFGNLVLETSGKPSIKDSSFSTMIFPIGKGYIRSVSTDNTDYVYRKYEETTANNTGGFSISLSGSDVFPYGSNATLNSDQRAEILISYVANGSITTATSATTSGDGTVLTVNTGDTPASSTPISVIFNIKKNFAKPIGKTLETVYMRINPSANTSGPYHLGWPDVYSIEGIWRGSNNTFTETSSGITNVTKNFTLTSNTNDRFYGIPSLKRKNLTIASSDRFLVKARVFRKETTGQYDQTFFTVNSYPVDDVSTVLPANRIRTEEIPDNLRDYLDFRPYAANTAVYATTPGSATIWTNSNRLNALSFGSAPLNLIAPNMSVEAEYSYYLARKDRLIINERGDFINIQGVSSEEPTAPNSPQRSMPIATISVPPFPSLTSKRANRVGKSHYGVSFTREDNKRYTMRDIGRIDKRIDKIEYYTVLNALEKSAEDLVIIGADGLDRFKNGILVDSFENLMIGDVRNDDFSASVDPSYKELSPSFRTYNIDLRISGNTNVVYTEDVATLPYQQTSMIRQPYGTKLRNCVTDFYNFTGYISLFPEYDGAPDYTQAPDVNFDIDLATPFMEFTDRLSEFVPLTTVDVNVSTTTSRANETSIVTLPGNRAPGGWTENEPPTMEFFEWGILHRRPEPEPTVVSVPGTRTVTNTTTTTRELVVTEGETTTQRVGDFVTDFQFQPYLRGKKVEIIAAGLRPNTLLYFFFDGINVTDRVARAEVEELDFSGPAVVGAPQPRPRLVRTSGWAANVRSDAQGMVYAIFWLPANTFYVGDRELLITDVPRLEDIGASTTSATAMYRGYNFSVERTGLEISTRQPSFDVDVSIERRRVETFEADAPAPRRQKDPIAQTFSVDEDYTSDNAVLITGVDIFFEKKSASAGVTLEIRNTENGYPGPKVLTFGQVRLSSPEVRVSSTGATPTRFTFPAPVTLSAGNDYCIVITPDGNDPDYRLLVAKTGQTDMVTGLRITQDTNSGMLFTSTNNKAWTSYQDEDMKFVLYKANFTSSSGELRLTNKENEFFDLEGYSGRFIDDEVVFAQRPSAAGSIAITEGNATVTGTGTSFTSTFTAGDMIAYQVSPTDYEVAVVSSVTNNTRMIIKPPPLVSNNSVSTFFSTVTGEVDYFNPNAPMRLHLKNSTAKSGRLFGDGDVVIGEQSGAVATIGEVINLPMSYIQPQIYRANFTKTKTNLIARTLSDGNAPNYLTSPMNLVFNNNNYFTKNTVIKSRSHEVSENSGVKSFELGVQLSSSSKTPRDCSPIIDHQISSVNVYEYFVNASNTEVQDSELRPNGLADARYLSKVVELADGFDAEDLRVWLTAYRPTGSHINVYGRFRAETDPTALSDIPWTRLVVKGNTNFTSSDANRFDFREFEYELPTTNPGNGNGAYLNDGDFRYVSEDGVIYENYKFFSVKIVLNSTGQHRIPRVKDMRAIALS